MKTWFKNFGSGILLGLAIIFLFAWLAYTIAILKSDPQLASAYVAVGTLILALVTALLVFFAWLSIRNGEEREERDKKERILNEIIKWVLNVKVSMLQEDAQAFMLEGRKRYERIFLAISDALFSAELMSLRASENSIPVEEELNDVWQSAFFCSQLASRIAGGKPTDEQRKRWNKNALDTVARIDQLEEQGNLTDKEMYDGQKDLLEKISLCLKKLVEVEASL